jgi:hypothetical protein
MLNGAVTIKEQSNNPNMFSIEYRSSDNDKYFWKAAVESTLAGDLSRLVDCLLNNKDPREFGYVPF